MTVASSALRLVFPGLVALGFIAPSACGGSVAADRPIDILPEAGAPAPAKPHPTPTDPADASADDAGDPNERDFQTTLVADEPGAEVQLAVSALTGRVVVAWIGLSSNGAKIRFAISDDKGATFAPAQSAGETVGDPIVAALDDGSFLVGGLRANCSSGIAQCSDGEIFLGRIAPGAAAITPLPSIFEPPDNAFIDHPWMSVHGGDVSIIGAAFPSVDGGGLEAGMTAWKSSDKGQSWTRSTVVAPGVNAAVGIPRFCAGDGNRLVAHFFDGASPTEGTLRFTDTADDGWTETNRVNAGGSPMTPIVSEGACVVKGDTIYMLLGTDATTTSGGADESLNPVFSDIHLVVSDDLGKTWSDRATISKAGTQYLLPDIDLEPDGTVDVFYYRGPSPNAPGAAEMVRIAGATMTTHVVHDAIRFVNDRSSPRWLGDYNGIGFLGVPVVAFGDNSTQPTKIRFGRLKH